MGEWPVALGDRNGDTSTDRGWPPVGVRGGQRWAWGGTLLYPMAWPWDPNDGMGVPSGAQYPTSHPWDATSGMGGGSPAVASAPRLIPGTPMVAWGGGVPAVPGPCQWPGSPQLCPHPWDPGDGTRIPGCACFPPPPQNAGGRGYHPYMLPPPMVGGGHTISTAPLCLGRVMGHRASPPPGTSPIQEGTELCWGHRVGSDTPPPPQG